MIVTRSLVLQVTLALAVGTFAACGSETDAAGQHAPAPDSKNVSCPSAADVGSVVGFPVQILTDTATAGSLVCGYQGTDSGAKDRFVTITAEPSDQAEKRLQDVQSGAKLLAGAAARPIDVGERGYAYGSSSKSEAVAVAHGRVYYAAIESPGQANLGDTSAAAVKLLERMVR